MRVERAGVEPLADAARRRTRWRPAVATAPAAAPTCESAGGVAGAGDDHDVRLERSWLARSSPASCTAAHRAARRSRWRRPTARPGRWRATMRAVSVVKSCTDGAGARRGDTTTSSVSACAGVERPEPSWPRPWRPRARRRCPWPRTCRSPGRRRCRRARASGTGALDVDRAAVLGERRAGRRRRRSPVQRKSSVDRRRVGGVDLRICSARRRAGLGRRPARPAPAATEARRRPRPAPAAMRRTAPMRLGLTPSPGGRSLRAGRPPGRGGCRGRPASRRTWAGRRWPSGGP